MALHRNDLCNLLAENSQGDQAVPLGYHQKKHGASDQACHYTHLVCAVGYQAYECKYHPNEGGQASINCLPSVNQRDLHDNIRQHCCNHNPSSPPGLLVRCHACIPPPQIFAFSRYNNVKVASISTPKLRNEVLRASEARGI